MELRTDYPFLSLDSLCDQFGKSRQAYYQRIKYQYRVAVQDEILIQMVEEIRTLMPKIGGRKLYALLSAQLPQDLMLGRDSFFDFLRRYNLLIRKRQRRVRTTYSHHWLRKYPNLIKDFVPTGANQLWVSDITFIKTNQGFVFLSLVTDAYSKKILGWSVGNTLEASHSIDALEMALKQLPKGHGRLIHHSDRGVQYCSFKYVKLLQANNIEISMTESGNPRENAVAERVNGILKMEWLNDMHFVSLQEVQRALEKIIWIYNTKRPHLSIGMMTPEYVHGHRVIPERLWKNYYKQPSFSAASF